MDVASFLLPSMIVDGYAAASKRKVLEVVAATAATHTGLGERDVLHALIARERLGSTAVGNGIAIPHARFTRLDRLVGVFVRLQQAVEFDAPDDKPVDVVFALLAPAENNAEHLRAMARVSRLLRDSHVRDSLRQAVTGEVLFSILTASDEESAG